MGTEIHNFKCNSRKDFLIFLEILQSDLRKNPENWENKNLPHFLEALTSCVEDIQGYYDNMNLNVNSDIASWQLFADLFKSAKIYE